MARGPPHAPNARHRVALARLGVAPVNREDPYPNPIASDEETHTMAKCSGPCRYEEVRVDNLRKFETWTIHWFTREITVTKTVSPGARRRLEEHAESLNVGRWTQACGRGCECDGQWEESTLSVPLRVGDGFRGAVVVCTADLRRRVYSGTCKPVR